MAGEPPISGLEFQSERTAIITAMIPQAIAAKTLIAVRIDEPGNAATPPLNADKSIIIKNELKSLTRRSFQKPFARRRTSLDAEPVKLHATDDGRDCGTSNESDPEVHFVSLSIYSVLL